MDPPVDRGRRVSRLMKRVFRLRGGESYSRASTRNARRARPPARARAAGSNLRTPRRRLAPPLRRVKARHRSRALQVTVCYLGSKGGVSRCRRDARGRRRTASRGTRPRGRVVPRRASVAFADARRGRISGPARSLAVGGRAVALRRRWCGRCRRRSRLDAPHRRSRRAGEARSAARHWPCEHDRRHGVTALSRSRADIRTPVARARRRGRERRALSCALRASPRLRLRRVLDCRALA